MFLAHAVADGVFCLSDERCAKWFSFASLIFYSSLLSNANLEIDAQSVTNLTSIASCVTLSTVISGVCAKVVVANIKANIETNFFIISPLCFAKK